MTYKPRYGGSMTELGGHSELTVWTQDNVTTDLVTPEGNANGVFLHWVALRSLDGIAGLKIQPVSGGLYRIFIIVDPGEPAQTVRDLYLPPGLGCQLYTEAGGRVSAHYEVL